MYRLKSAESARLRKAASLRRHLALLAAAALFVLLWCWVTGAYGYGLAILIR